MQVFKYFKSLIILLLFCGYVFTLKAQTSDCELIEDPLLNDNEILDPCCGEYISHEVCYQIVPIANGLVPCSGNDLVLLSFDGPNGYISEEVGFDNWDQLASYISQVDGMESEFTIDYTNSTMCASFDISPDYGDIQISLCNDNSTEIITITPTITETNDCPIISPDVSEVLSGETPDDLVFINGSIGQITTSEIVNGVEIVEGAPSPNDVGNIINGLINSGVLQNPVSCININCIFNDFLNEVNGESFGVSLDELISLDILPDDVDENTLELVFQDSLNEFFNQVNEFPGGFAGYMNDALGFNFDTTACPGNGPNFGDKPSGNYPSRNSETGKTGADLNFFTNEIPGLGQGGNVQSTPSPSSMSAIQGIKGGVDLYNGSQNTVIPLHTLVANDISVPISIGSTNNGLKVNSLGSTMGQHWGLNASGSISRMVKGLPDEYNGTVEGVGVAKSSELIYRTEILSNLGARLDFSGSEALTSFFCADTIQQIRLGATLIKNDFMDISYTPMDIGSLNVTFSFPAFSIWGITVSITAGMKVGTTADNEILRNVIFREEGMGHYYVGNNDAMNSFGDISELDHNYLDGVSQSEKLKVLKLIHPNQEFEENKILSDIIANYDKWKDAIEVFLDDDYTEVIKTKKLDLQPDEFYFSAGGYSGKFYINIDQEPIMTPYIPGVEIEIGNIVGGHFSSFSIKTPDGLVYEYGSTDLTGVDFTRSTNYTLPNYYTYPEEGISRTKFKKAEIDVGYLTKFPFIGFPKFKTYGNTYDRNYKIMDAPEYASTWHLISIKSRTTKEEVNFIYEEQDELTYYDKSWSHSFPNFKLGNNGNFETDELTHLNPFHFIPTKWENGRTEFTYAANQTFLKRWDLVSIQSNRGESVVFKYDAVREEIAGDHLCSRIEILRNNALYKGWEFDYSVSSSGSPIVECGEYQETGSPSLSASTETRFNLGELYEKKWFEFNLYLLFDFRIGKCLKIPINRLPIGFLGDRIFYGNRETLSEFGSLMEVKRFKDPFNEERYGLDIDKETAIFQAESKRSFLKAIKEVDQTQSLHGFVTNIEYFNSDEFPKRFSVHQDVFGYYNNNQSGSPFPPVNYKEILGGGTASSSNGMMALHFPFSNIDVAGNIHGGQSVTASLGQSQVGALKSIEMITGATITYDYELNNIPEIGEGAGIRVKRKTENPGDTPAKITLYNYSNPSYNNLPIRQYQNTKDVYYENLENRVLSSSSILNELDPNKNAFIGYGTVTESWADIGRVIHYFSTPDNFTEKIIIHSDDEGESPEYSFYEETKTSIFDSQLVPLPDVFIENLHPSLSKPDEIIRKYNLFFGVEYSTETYDNSGELVQKDSTLFETYGKSKGRDLVAINLFDSQMSQYSHRGSWWDNYSYRRIFEYLPFGSNSIGPFLSFLKSILDGSLAPHPFRKIERFYQIAQYEIPSINIRAKESSSTFYPSGGGSARAGTLINYVGLPTNAENLVRSTITSYSDGIGVKTVNHYAFDENNSSYGQEISSLFDNSAIQYLRSIDYWQPLHQKTYSSDDANELCTNCTLTSNSFTALTLSNEKIFPIANYALQNGVLTLNGKFADDNGDALPNKYYKAKWEATINSPLSDFFDPIELEWNQQRQLLSKEYLEYKTTNYYSGFFEYLGQTDHNGVSTTYSYDVRTRLEQMSKYNGLQLTKFIYSIGPGANSITSQTDFGTDEIQEQIQYLDGLGKVVSVVRSNDGALLSSAKYDNFWRPIITSQIGKGILVNEYEYSPTSRLLMTTDEENNVFQYSYEGGGENGSFFTKNTVIDPNGHSISKEYDALENLKIIDQEGRLTIHEYDPLWRLAKILNPIGEEYIYNYNAMGLLFKTTFPGGGAKESVFDEKYRLVGTKDGNGNTLIHEYDAYDRIIKTYETNILPGSSGIADYSGDVTSLFNVNDLFNEVTYPDNTTTYINWRKDLLLDDDDEEDIFVVTDMLEVDDLGRPVHTNTTYPDATVEQTLSYNGAMQLTSNIRTIDFNGDTLEMADNFGFDNVLRPKSHEVTYDDVSTVRVSEMHYDNEDRLKVKLIGASLNDQFLQQMDYYYDKIGRIVAINSFGAYECKVGEEICDFTVNIITRGAGACSELTYVKVNNEVYTLPEPVNPLEAGAENAIAQAIEDALTFLGLDGEVTEVQSYTVNGVEFAITVSNSNATSISLGFAQCEKEFAFVQGDCCEVIPPSGTSGENTNLVGDATDNPDLYYQLMEYDGLDINKIEIGSKCFYGKMINNYGYDELHRLTDMNNILYAPTPFPSAFNTHYSYDDAGNIDSLIRNGFVGYNDAGLPIFELIDELNYSYNGTSSKLTSIEDVVEDLDHRAFGVAPPENQALSYGYDGNGNMAAAGPNTFDYNILNLPIEISGPGGTAYQEYVSSGGKYKKIVEPSGGEIDTIYYLGGVEFINGLPDNYFFGDGRIAWEETSADTLKSWYQYRLTDHLGNTMVFFDDKDEDGQIMTELQTDDPQELEVRQRLWYYPFGMQMDGIVNHETTPHHAYRYNGKELDEVSQTYEYGFRYYDPTIGKFTGVDPIADQFAWVSPFNYAENEPIAHIDLHGLQKVSINSPWYTCAIECAINNNDDFQMYSEIIRGFHDNFPDTYYERLNNGNRIPVIEISPLEEGIEIWGRRGIYDDSNELIGLGDYELIYSSENLGRLNIDGRAKIKTVGKVSGGARLETSGSGNYGDVGNYESERGDHINVDGMLLNQRAEDTGESMRGWFYGESGDPYDTVHQFNYTRKFRDDTARMRNGEYDWYDVRDKEGNVLRKLFHKKGDNE